jgi:sarcosine oxidase
MNRVIVIGLGAMGSSAAQQLAERGVDVIGFDQFTPPHTHGSSHGQTRIIRQCYWEDPRYVPLLLRAYELWRKLEADTGKPLLHVTGGLMIGRASGELVRRSEMSARRFALPHEVLSASELRRRYPVFNVEEDMLALWEDNAGYLRPEACIEEQLRQATRAAADLHFNEPVLDWQASPGGGVSVRTARKGYVADRLVITAGPWAPQILRDMQLPLRVTRQVVYWFEPRCNIDLFRENRLPVYLLETEATHSVLYGFPLTGPESEGVKVAQHGSNETCTPESVAREMRAGDEFSIRERLAGTIPLLGGRLLHAETCLYTMTPDGHFMIDKHPEFPQVMVAAGFSGHGFKFASVIGEILADLATDQEPQRDLDLFQLQRFQNRSSLQL